MTHKVYYVFDLPFKLLLKGTVYYDNVIFTNGLFVLLDWLILCIYIYICKDGDTYIFASLLSFGSVLPQTLQI